MWNQARTHGVAWGGKRHPWSTVCQLFATPGNFLVVVYCCFIFVAAKAKCSETLAELNVGSREMLESSNGSYIYIIHLIAITLINNCDNIKYEINSGILYHVILPS